MVPSRRKLLARLGLVAFAALGALWLSHLDFNRRISTSVLDLIPSAGDSAELRVLRRLATDRAIRVVLFEWQGPGCDRAARRFAADLDRSSLFSEATLIGDASGQADLGRALFERRFTLLLPSWLGRREQAFAATGLPSGRFSSWLAEGAAADLEAFLARPEAPAAQAILPRDPLLLVPGLLDQAPKLVLASGSAGKSALVWARLRASPLAEAGQTPVFAAIAAAQADVEAAVPGAVLRWTGVNRFAAASRARIESEIRNLNLLSIGAVLIIACVFVRRSWKLLHLLPILACSLLGAWCAATLVFPRLHILVFVLGSLLSGVAVDYGFYIYLQPFASPGESYGAKLRRLLRPLLASCLTTVIGFSFLLASDLPLIRQLGLFVAAGLLAALGAAMAYFAQLDRPYLESRSFGALDGGSTARRFARLAAFAALAVALIGPWRLKWKDDVHELDIPSPQLRQNDEAVRARFGDSEDNGVYLTFGDTLAAARSRLQDFAAWLARADPAANAVNLGLVLPTADDWSAFPSRLRSLGSFSADFRAALDRHGFDVASFSPFFDAWDSLLRNPPAEPYDALGANLAAQLHGPLGDLMSAPPGSPWFITLADHPVAVSPPADLQTVDLSQVQSLNTLFTRYRWSALRLSLVGLALVIGSVFAIYPPRRGRRIAVIPAGACFFVFGLFGLGGQTLNLFHLLGAFLGVCLSHNYSIFSSESAAAGAAPPAAVRLSALCAAASFGVLAASRIPVIHALGATVALIVLTALAAIELEPLVRRPPPS